MRLSTACTVRKMVSTPQHTVPLLIPVLPSRSVVGYSGSLGRVVLKFAGLVSWCDQAWVLCEMGVKRRFVLFGCMFSIEKNLHLDMSSRPNRARYVYPSKHDQGIRRWITCTESVGSRCIALRHGVMLLS